MINKLSLKPPRHSLIKRTSTSLAFLSALLATSTAFAYEPEEGQAPASNPYSLGNDWEGSSEIIPSFSTIYRGPRGLSTTEPLRPSSQAQALTAGEEEAEEAENLPYGYTLEGAPAAEPTSAFEQHLQDPARLKATLEAAGIDPTEDNIASRFWEEKDLYIRLVNNQHGTLLNLIQTSFTQTKSLLIFDALRETLSVQRLNLSKCQIPLPYFLALGTALSLNTSLQVIDLQQATWPNQDITLLGLILQNNRSLQEVIFSANLNLNEAALQSFYKMIESNRHLRLIRWSQEAFKPLKTIARTNPVAMVHLGVSYLEKVMAPQFDFLPVSLSPSLDPVKEAIALFTKADKINHPLASYELGKIKEAQQQFPEALKWYQRSADLGYAAAQYKIGEYYRAVWPQKEPVLPTADYGQALEWFHRSAKQGYAPALYRLGRLYEAGRSGSVSLSKAGDYFYEAVIRGYPEAFVALGGLCGNPSYEYADETMAKYYLEWGKKFPEVSFQAERLLKFPSQG
ncbi:MAG: sel1 repeat family protein [Candidatus Paracaedibacteraceae bacterium]|nr:sel1 repeat family protein [Candidatus Paracaedibacteraceae bacterium]